MGDSQPAAPSGGSPDSSVGRVIWVNRFFHPDESATSIMLTDLVHDLAQNNGEPDKDGWPAFQHHLVTSNAKYAGHDGDPSTPVPGVIIHRIPAIGQGNRSLLARLVNFALFYVGALVHLLRFVRRDDVVVALTDPPLVGVISDFVARLKGAHSVHWVQDIFPETASRLGFLKEHGVADRLLRRMRNASWRGARASVTIGDNMRDYLRSHGVEETRVTVIQNWAGDHAIRPLAAEENPLRRDWEYSADHCVVGYSGNLGRAHEIETKIAAMRLLGQRGEQALRFLFIGGGARQDDLRKAASELPEQLISFRPYQPMSMLGASLSVPDVHWISLQPELEGLIVPSKLYGALAVGRPIIFIGDAKAEIARLIAEAECGASFTPGEAEKLADYLAMLAAEPSMRQQLGSRGRAYLDEELPRSRRIGEWRDLIASLRGSTP